MVIYLDNYKRHSIGIDGRQCDISSFQTTSLARRIARHCNNATTSRLSRRPFVPTETRSSAIPSDHPRHKSSMYLPLAGIRSHFIVYWSHPRCYGSIYLLIKNIHQKWSTGKDCTEDKAQKRKAPGITMPEVRQHLHNTIPDEKSVFNKPKRPPKKVRRLGQAGLRVSSRTSPSF